MLTLIIGPVILIALVCIFILMLVIRDDEELYETTPHYSDGTSVYNSSGENVVDNGENSLSSKESSVIIDDSSQYVTDDKLQDSSTTLSSVTNASSTQSISDSTTESTENNSSSDSTKTSDNHESLLTTTEKETTTLYASGEIVELSNTMYSEFKHQTSNTVWKDGSTAQVWHQEQYDYLLDIANKWYEGEYSDTAACEAMMNCPTKDEQDYYEVYGIEFFNPNYEWRVVDCETQKIEYKGYINSLSKNQVYEYMCENGLRSVTRNFLFLKVSYSGERDITTLYYMVAKCGN